VYGLTPEQWREEQERSDVNRGFISDYGKMFGAGIGALYDWYTEEDNTLDEWFGF
jgi:hypothetical protein